MDMNGSMAFYRPETPIYAWCRRLFASGKLRGLYIMGGILDSEASPLISPFFVKPGVGVNRLGCATMNQLYAAGPAGAFFEDCATHNVPLITATSNLIIKAFTITNDDEYHSALTPILHRAKPLFRAGFDAYYIPDFVSKPKKAYDVVSAIALLYDMIHTDTLAHRGVSSITLRAIRLPRTPKRLYFNNEYGISLVSSAPTAREAAEAYMRTLQEQLASTADAVVEGLAKNQRRQHMQAEVDLLTRKLNEDPVGFLKAYEVMDIDEMDVSAMTSLLKEVVDQASSSPLG
ncbi:hypothetical protein BC830DRAFT_1175363 [Chytriomyces sp. MP71]|nr:hypothetical protein BC830DRAFT_1175363 [Chytriomyces sp. MP71]